MNMIIYWPGTSSGRSISKHRAKSTKRLKKTERERDLEDRFRTLNMTNISSKKREEMGEKE